MNSSNSLYDKNKLFYLLLVFEKGYIKFKPKDIDILNNKLIIIESNNFNYINFEREYSSHKDLHGIFMQDIRKIVLVGYEIEWNQRDFYEINNPRLNYTRFYKITGCKIGYDI